MKQLRHALLILALALASCTLDAPAATLAPTAVSTERERVTTTVTAEMRMSATMPSTMTVTEESNESAVSTTNARARAGSSFDVLQLNLCNSGLADCYAGGNSIDEGISVINEVAPDVVTLNEICRDDIRRMAEETGYHFVFTAARNGDTGGLFTCQRHEKTIRIMGSAS